MNKKGSYALVLLSIGFIVALYFTHALKMDYFYNSDSLYLPCLCNDLIEAGGRYRSWYLTPAPYFFPDGVIYFFCYFITGNFYYAIPLFFFIQLMLLFVMTSILFGEFFDKKTAMLFSCASFSYFALLCTHQPCSYISTWWSVPFPYFLLSAHHCGAFIVLLALFIFVCKLLKTNDLGKENRIVFILSLLSLFTTASDKLFLMHCALSLSLALIYLWIRGFVSIKKALKLIFCVDMAAVLGYLSYKPIVFNPVMPGNAGNDVLLTLIDPRNLKSYLGYLITTGFYRHITEEIVILKNVFHADPVVSLIILFFYVGLFCVLLFYKRFAKKLLTKEDEKKIFFASFSLVNVVSIVCLLIATPFFIVSRYQLPLLAMPVLLFPLLLTFCNWRRVEKCVKVLAGLLIVTSMVGLAGKLFAQKDIRFKSEYYPDDVACMDRFFTEVGATHGVTDYWNAKKMVLLSKNRLQIASFFSDLSPQRWIINGDWFRESYDFVIIQEEADDFLQKPLDEEKIVKMNGEPKKIKVCGSKKIFFYGKGGLVMEPDFKR